MTTERWIIATVAVFCAPWLVLSCATSLNEGGNNDDDGPSGGAGAIAGDGGSSVTVGGAPPIGQGGAMEGGGGEGGGVSLCGNSVKDEGEQCDGADFGDATCESLGLGGGILKCNTSCAIVVSSCTPAEVCLNGMDDDQDQLIDCEDTDDCATVPACNDSCVAPKLASGMFFFDDTTSQGRPNQLSNSCSGTSGPEVVYEVVPNFDGFIAVQADCYFHDCSIALRSACDDVGTESECANDITGFGSEHLGFAVVSGESYFVVVDGAETAAEGHFYFNTFESTPEDCGNFYDDDFDNRVDCEDSNCAGSLDCAAGSGAVGDACTAHTDCASAANDDPFCIDETNLAFPNGYCSEFCDLSADDCPAGSQCGDYTFTFSGNGTCFKNCANASDCGTGYQCMDYFGNGKVCII